MGTFEGSFYVTLPSNTKNEHFDNKTSHYITNLPANFNLFGDYEVALVGIGYPHSWSNIPGGKRYWVKFRSNFHYKEVGRYSQCTQADCHPPQWPSVREFINEVNRNRPSHFSSSLRYIDGKISLKANEGEILGLSDYVKNYLGLEEIYAESNDDNRTTIYTSTLSHGELKFSGGGVVPLIVPITLSNEERYFLAHSTTIYFKKRDLKQHIQTAYLERGYYKSANVLAMALNRARPPHFKGMFEYNPLKRKMQLFLAIGEEMEFSSRLAGILGCGQKPNGRNNRTFSRLLIPKYTDSETLASQAFFLMPNSTDLNLTMHNMFIYSNLVELSLVGHSMLPLLATIKISGNDGEYIERLFLSPHYVRVFSSNVKSIEIKLADDQGELVRFDSGKVLTTLHFRPRKDP